MAGTITSRGGKVLSDSGEGGSWCPTRIWKKAEWSVSCWCTGRAVVYQGRSDFSISVHFQKSWHRQEVTQTFNAEIIYIISMQAIRLRAEAEALRSGAMTSINATIRIPNVGPAHQSLIREHCKMPCNIKNKC